MDGQSITPRPTASNFKVKWTPDVAFQVRPVRWDWHIFCSTHLQHRHCSLGCFMDYLPAKKYTLALLWVFKKNQWHMKSIENHSMSHKMDPEHKKSNPWHLAKCYKPAAALSIHKGPPASPDWMPRLQSRKTVVPGDRGNTLVVEPKLAKIRSKED